MLPHPGASLVLTCVASLLLGVALHQDEVEPDHDVIGNLGDAGNVWVYLGMASPPSAQLRDPSDRLTVKVKNGDVVLFRNEEDGGTHGVIFERARSDLDGGIWEVVDGPQMLGPINATFVGFNPDDALTTPPAPGGQQILAIRVADLKAGAENGILFACNPHSKRGDEGRMMLGVIVLDDGEVYKKPGEPR